MFYFIFHKTMIKVLNNVIYAIKKYFLYMSNIIFEVII